MWNTIEYAKCCKYTLFVWKMSTQNDFLTECQPPCSSLPIIRRSISWHLSARYWSAHGLPCPWVSHTTKSRPMLHLHSENSAFFHLKIPKSIGSISLLYLLHQMVNDQGTYNNNTTKLYVNIVNMNVHATIILVWWLYYWINNSMVNRGHHLKYYWTDILLSNFSNMCHVW